MTVQFDKLQDVVTATERNTLDQFNMWCVCEEHDCGTVGCLIGNYNAFAGRHPLRFGADMRDVPYSHDEFKSDRWGDWTSFGLTVAEYLWLFNDSPYCERYLPTSWMNVAHSQSCPISRDQALARLRKFIAYKRRKHALIHDEKYGVSDKSRRAEGNQLFCVLAVQDALAEMALAAAM